MAIQINKKMVEVYTTSDGKEYADREQAEKHERWLVEKSEKEYVVTYYFTGTYTTRIKALDEEEAKEKAKKLDYPYPEDINWELDFMKTMKD